MRFLVLFVAYQAAWFAAVLGAARGWIWAGPAIVAVVLAAFGWGLAPRARGRWLAAVALLGLAGGMLDSLVAASGLIRFGAGFVPWIAPPWIVAVWCLSAVWLPSLGALAGRPVIAGLLGAVGGPAAYAGGVRLGAAAFPSPSWPSLLTYGILWAVALPLLVRVPALVDPTGSRRPA